MDYVLLVGLVSAGFNGTLTHQAPLVEVHARAPCQADFTMRRDAS
jgi:hypothetical protein